jgi:hypothetical protein
VAGKKRTSKAKAAAGSPPSPAIAPADERSWKRYALMALATLYLADVWLDAVGSNLPAKLLPRAVLFFGQIAALFPKAGEKQIDYRAEGWLCSEHKWVEIDPRPFFPIDVENKENRFYRAIQFHRYDRKVMRALDEYVTKHHNASREPRDTIGGVRFLSLRIPYPPVGATIEPYKRQELASYPEDQRKNWYWTPGSMRRERCGERASSSTPASKDKDDDDTPSTKGPEDDR